MDTGCTSNIVRLDVATALNIPITPSKQRAVQADGSTPLDVVGEVQIVFTHDSHELMFNGLVCETLDFDILAGAPFHSTNDVYARPSRKIVYVKENAYPYTISSEHHQRVGLCTFDTLHPDRRTSVLPGEYREANLPPALRGCSEGAVEPVTSCVDHGILDTGDDEVQVVRNHNHLVYAQPATAAGDISVPSCVSPSPQSSIQSGILDTVDDEIQVVKTHNHLVHARPATAAIDISVPSCVSPSPQSSIQAVSEEQRSDTCTVTACADVFGPAALGCGGSFDVIQAVVVMGPAPPPRRRGRTPLYPASYLQLLQQHLDVPEERDTVAEPDTYNVNAVYVGPAFHVTKSDDRFRAVSACANIGSLARPTPSLMPDVETTIRTIAQRTYIFWDPGICV